MIDHSQRLWQRIIKEEHLNNLLKPLAWFFIMVFLLVFIFYLYQVNTKLDRRLAQMKAELAAYEEAEEYEVMEMNVTKYAPLDEEAVLDLSFEGDPAVTASGEKPIPGKTAAAGPNIPFGTRIYVEGLGWHIVNDRGGNIGPDDIDIVTESREKALEWGKQELLVIIEE